MPTHDTETPLSEDEWEVIWDLTQEHHWAGRINSDERWSLCHCGVKVPWVADDDGDPSDDSWVRHLLPVLLASDWLAARDAVVAAQAKAEALREAADAIRPGDHTCFKMWCPQCAVRKEREQRQRSLRARAVSSVPQATEPTHTTEDES